MKICPQCHTKYTDDTLKFCLQDGKPLESVTDDKTLVFDQESFANDQTIADNFSDQTEEVAGETYAYANQSTRSDEKETPYAPPTEPEFASEETVVRKEQIGREPEFTSTETNTKSGGFGFLTGFVIALLLIGLIGLGILAVIYLPGFLVDNKNTVANTNNINTVEQEKTLSDTDEVKVSASSTRKSDKGNFYYPKFAFDGNSRTAWCEGSKGAGIGQWIAFDFSEEVILEKIIIEPGYFKTEEIWGKNNRLKRATVKFSDGTIKSVEFPNEMKEQKINAGSVKTKSVMITIKDIFPGLTDTNDTLISEVSFVVKKK